MHFCNDEMCEHKFNPLKGEIIPGCVFDISFYQDCYCHNCNNVYQPNDTHHPLSADPSVHSLRKFLFNLDNDNPPKFITHRLLLLWLPPHLSPAVYLHRGPYWTPTLVQWAQYPPNYIMKNKFCKMLKASGFPNFKKVRKCQFKKGSIFKNLGGN